MEFFLTSPTVIMAAFFTYLNWSWQEKAKKKRDSYETLLDLADCFYEGKNEGKREKFIDEYRKSFLYASDDVLKSINNFYESVHTGNDKKDVDREERFAEIVITMRKDLFPSVLYRLKLFFSTSISSTQLTSKDFKHVKGN